MPFYHNYGAALSEVEVDVLTGEVTVMAAHLLYDCGKSLNPAIDIGQVGRRASTRGWCGRRRRDMTETRVCCGGHRPRGTGVVGWVDRLVQWTAVTESRCYSLLSSSSWRQVEGAFVQGLGYYLTEEAVVASDGTLQSKGTWTYKPPMTWDLPQDWRVELLENAGFDKGFLSSKASGTTPTTYHPPTHRPSHCPLPPALSVCLSGEPPLVLATSVFMAVRDAIVAARAEMGLPAAGFTLQAPATVERVHKACGTSLAWMRLDGGKGPWMDDKPAMVVDVAVSGAGLGGLAMGIALRNKGIDGHLFEKAPALRDVSQVRQAHSTRKQKAGSLSGRRGQGAANELLRLHHVGVSTATVCA